MNMSNSKSTYLLSNKKGLNSLVLVLLLIIFILVLVGCEKETSENQSYELKRVRIGITPYQDTALPVVAHELGWYEESGIEVKLVPLAWGDVVNAISGNSIDVALYNFNSFQAPYENASEGRTKPIFYAATYVFKGAAIIVDEETGFKLFRDIENEEEDSRENRIREIAEQLRGKRIAVTEGTEFEQIVLAALEKADLDPQKDVTLIHAAPEDSLAAFLAGNIDAFGAGLTERIEARRHGGTELLVASDVTAPVLDGLITSETFAEENPEVMQELLHIWFKTIQFMEKDVKTNSKYVLDYLQTSASTRYTPEEYAIAWTFQVFPSDPEEAWTLLYTPGSPYYWKDVWSANNEFLIEQDKLKKPVPYSAFWGEKTFQSTFDIKD